MTAAPNDPMPRAPARRCGATCASRASAPARSRCSARVALVWAGIAIAAGCSSDREKLAKELEPARSWAATLQLAGESWLGNRVPSAYLGRTAGEARESLTKSGTSVAQLVEAPPALRDRALATLAQAAATADSMAGAIERRDTLQLRRELAQIGALGNALDSLVKQAKGSG